MMLFSGCKKDSSAMQPAQQATAMQAPLIVGFSPDIAGIGYTVTINGSNFIPDTSKDIVSFNGVQSFCTSATNTQLTAIVPIGATSGNISVVTNNQKSVSSSAIQIKTLTVTTIAGSGELGHLDGPALIASFGSPENAIPDGKGSYYITDPYNHKIRKLTSDGTVSTYAGGIYGFTNGDLGTALFGQPYDIAFDKAGNMYVTDYAGNNIRKITPGGIVSTFAGDSLGNYGSADGTGNNARFFSPAGIVIDNNDNIFVVDVFNSSIRKITPAGVVTTLAGSDSPGFADGTGSSASFQTPFYVAIDSNDNLYVADDFNGRICKVTQTGVVTTIASLNHPLGITIDHGGNIWVTDIDQRIDMITPAGMVYTLAGNEADFKTIDGVGIYASFGGPQGIKIDPSGALIVVDNNTNKIRKITIQ